jgi:1-acyl-sn-glycerol-3-phosphate acyltransferase
LPPPWIRRPLTVAVWLIASLICLGLSPLLLALAALAAVVTHSRRPLIVARLIISYFIRELVALIVCGLLWLASGAGWRMKDQRFQTAHWQLLRWLLHGITELGLSMLHIDVTEESSDQARRALRRDAPVIIFSRHAGPGDTILLIDRLLSHFDRRPSIVLKEAVALDPGVDLVAHRLPHAVIDTSDGQDAQDQIEAVTARLSPRGVLLLFPEGGNFTPRRRRTILRKLWREDRVQEAQTAERLSHVLPPRPPGALAALRARPGGDVIFAAHTGLGLAAYPRQIWRHMPIDTTLQTRMWLVPGAQIPDQPQAQIEWLNRWWKQIDDWIDEQQTEPPPPAW